MDKYEYKLKLDEMKSALAEGDVRKAEELADAINWKRVRNTNSLIKASEVYEAVGRMNEAKELLLMAYDHSSFGRTIVYRLAEIELRLENYNDAMDYYEEFIEVAPNDNLKYVLKYKIYKAKGASIGELINILEDLKEQEYMEEWAYELAYLYHQAGMSDKCIEACDELILWFGDGAYVERALELKMLYQPLTKQQEEKYRTFRQNRDGVVEVHPSDYLHSGEIVQATVTIPQVTTNASKFNTVNLQQEIAKNMQQIMEATEKEEVADSMDAIKKAVEDIPYLQLPQEDESEEKESKYGHIETDEEIDGSLKINFKELLAEDSDGQISLLNVPQDPMIERQITGQMSIEDVLSEWEKTKRAAEAALQEAEQRKFESAKARALQEAEDIMERLVNVIPQLDAGLSPKDLLEQEYLQGTDAKDEAAAQLFKDVNNILSKEIEKLEQENEDIDQKKKDMLEEEPEPIEEPEMVEEPMDEESIEEPELPVIEIADIMEEETEEEEPVEEPMPIEEAESVEEPEPIAEELPEIAPVVLTEDDIKDIQEKEPLPEMAVPEKLIEDEVVTQLSDAQKEIFSYFVPIQGMEKQLCQVLTGVKQRLGKDKTSASGNIVVQGNSGSGKTVLATNLVKVIQQDTDCIKGKIGKIEASALNTKDITELLKKVRGGCLIIESAGNLSKETAVKLGLQMSQDTDGMLVILEDSKEGIKRALALDENFAKKFTEKVSIPIFSIDELVEFAKSYTRELEFEIDEMGILALYNRISSIEKLDEATTLFEVKDIVDSAVERSERRSLKKAFQFLGKRSAQSDLKVLREKDFEE